MVVAMRTLCLAALVLLALSGCLGSGTGPQEGAGDGGPRATYDERFAGLGAPPGRATDSAAVAHGPGGASVAWGLATGVPCLVVSDWDTYEPSLGVTSAGNLFLYPAFRAPNEALNTAGQFLGLGIVRTLDQGETFERVHS